MLSRAMKKLTNKLPLLWLLPGPFHTLLGESLVDSLFSVARDVKEKNALETRRLKVQQDVKI